MEIIFNIVCFLVSFAYAIFKVYRGKHFLAFILILASWNFLQNVRLEVLSFKIEALKAKVGQHEQ